MYEGEWLNDQQNGQGMMTYPNDDHFEGEFEAGKKNGNGRFFYADTGSTYVGVWKDNIPKCGEYKNEVPDMKSLKKPLEFLIPEITLKNPTEVLKEASQHARL